MAGTIGVCWEPVDVVNCVVTCTLIQDEPDSDCTDSRGAGDGNYDLPRLAETLRDVEFDPAKFAALKLCRPSPFSKGLFFRSGKFVCVGNTTIAAAHDAVAHFAAAISAAVGVELHPVDMKVQNIVASTRTCVAATIDLARIARRLPTYTQYEPEVRATAAAAPPAFLTDPLDRAAVPGALLPVRGDARRPRHLRQRQDEHHRRAQLCRHRYGASGVSPVGGCGLGVFFRVAPCDSSAMRSDTKWVSRRAAPASAFAAASLAAVE